MINQIKVSKVFVTSNLIYGGYGIFCKNYGPISSAADVSSCLAKDILDCSTPLHVYNPNIDYIVIILKVCPLVKGRQLLNNFYVEAVFPGHYYLPTLRQDLNGLTHTKKISVLSNSLDLILSGEAKTKQGLTIKEYIATKYSSINGYYISEVVLCFTTNKPGSLRKSFKQNLSNFIPLVKATAYLGNGLYLSFSLMATYITYVFLFTI